MKIIGITGGIGAGKSELLRYIGKHYRSEIYMADEVAHQVEQPGTECFQRLKELLGSGMIAQDGTLDRAVMAEKIFANPGLLEQVNGIVHPAVKEFLLQRMQQAREEGKTELFFVEAALLIEGGYGPLVDEMWYVYADEAARRDRLEKNRGYSPEKITGIISRQLSEEDFRKNSDFILDNSGSLEESYRQIDRKLEAFTWQE